MRAVFTDYAKYEKMAQELQPHLIENFTEEAQYKKFADAVIGEEELELQDWLSQFEEQLEVHE